MLNKKNVADTKTVELMFLMWIIAQMKHVQPYDKTTRKQMWADVKNYTFVHIMKVRVKVIYYFVLRTYVRTYVHICSYIMILRMICICISIRSYVRRYYLNLALTKILWILLIQNPTYYLRVMMFIISLLVLWCLLFRYLRTKVHTYMIDYLHSLFIRTYA